MADVRDLIYAVLRDRAGLGVSPSIVWLTSMVLAAADPRDEATESGVMRAVTKAVKTGRVPGVRDLGRVSGLEGRPRVLAIRPEQGGPENPVGLIQDRVDGLGSPGARKAALEDRLVEELRSRGFWVMSFPRKFHKVSADFAVRGEDGQQWNVECRNLRWATTVRLHLRDRRVTEAAKRADAKTVFIVPRATRRFRREVVELDGIVLETGVYLVDTREQCESLLEIGLPWDAATSDGEIGAVANLLLGAVGPLVRRGSLHDPDDSVDPGAELRRIRKETEYRRLHDEARAYQAQRPEPHRVTMTEMAKHVGVSRSTLQRACKVWGPLVSRGRKPTNPPS